MGKKINIEVELDCDRCGYYRYIRCYGYDCFHSDAPQLPEDLYDGSDTGIRGNEPLAENREGDVPKWCPYLHAKTI